MSMSTDELRSVFEEWLRSEDAPFPELHDVDLVGVLRGNYLPTFAGWEANKRLEQLQKLVMEALGTLSHRVMLSALALGDTYIKMEAWPASVGAGPLITEASAQQLVLQRATSELRKLEQLLGNEP